MLETPGSKSKRLGNTHTSAQGRAKGARPHGMTEHNCSSGRMGMEHVLEIKTDEGSGWGSAGICENT